MEAVVMADDKALVVQEEKQHLLPYSTPLHLRTLDEYLKLGEVLWKSTYFNDVKSAAQAVAKMLAGAELGFGPFVSMSGVYIQGGRPSFMANLIAASVKKNGYTYTVDKLDNTECQLTFYDKNGKLLGVSRFTMDDAILAGLTTGSNSHSWKKFPRNMLFSRAMSNGARWYTPEIFGGATPYTPDELDAVIDGDTGEVLVTADNKPNPNGTTPTQSEQTKTTPPTPTPVTPPEPEKVSDLEKHFGTPSITEQERLKQEAQKAVIVKFWSGKEWVEKPADEHIAMATGGWFVDVFVGEGKAFAHPNALFGKSGTNNKGHLGVHYNRINFVNPKDHKDALTWREFTELVAYAWWKQGDREHGTLSLPRYQDKLKEELDKQDAISYESSDATTGEAVKDHVPSVVEIREMAKTINPPVDIDALAQDVLDVNSLFIDDNDVTVPQRSALWNLVKFIKEHITAEPDYGNVKKQQELLKIELGL